MPVCNTAPLGLYPSSTILEGPPSWSDANTSIRGTVFAGSAGSGTASPSHIAKRVSVISGVENAKVWADMYSWAAFLPSKAFNAPD